MDKGTQCRVWKMGKTGNFELLAETCTFLNVGGGAKKTVTVFDVGESRVRRFVLNEALRVLPIPSKGADKYRVEVNMKGTWQRAYRDCTLLQVAAPGAELTDKEIAILYQGTPGVIAKEFSEKHKVSQYPRYSLMSPCGDIIVAELVPDALRIVKEEY